MVTSTRARLPFAVTTAIVRVYIAVVVVTLLVLALLALSHSSTATSAAWIHAAVVAWFAILLPIRLRAARRGSERGRWAVAIIAVVSATANIVEAAAPGLFPTWMRIEEVGIALLMLAIVGTDLSRQ